MEYRAAAFQQSGALSVVQLITSAQDTFRYISGAKAIKSKFIEVKEMSDAGSVNNIKVINHSVDYVFFSDGDILAGAKQNRVLNTSILLKPESVTVMPVSCVEQGRWKHVSAVFHETDYSAPAVLRAKKARRIKVNLDNNSGHFTDQQEVWDDVNKYSTAFNLESETKSITDVFEHHKNDFDEIIKQFNPSANANGLAIFINGHLLNIEIFNRRDIFSEYFAKLLRSAAMETAYLTRHITLSETEAVFKTFSFLDKITSMEYSSHNGAGAGEERRFESKEAAGFELSFDKTLIHLTALNISS